MEEFNSFRWLRFTASAAVGPEGCEENLYLGDIWSQVGQWFQTKLVIQQRLSAHGSPHRISKSQWRTVPHISRWWHFHGERRVEWAASDQIRHRVEKPGDVALSHGERTGGSRVCKNHSLDCLSYACPLPWRQPYPSGCVSLAWVTLRRGERAGRWQESLLWKSQLPLPLLPTLWSTRHLKSWIWVGTVLLKYQHVFYICINVCMYMPLESRKDSRWLTGIYKIQKKKKYKKIEIKCQRDKKNKKAEKSNVDSPKYMCMCVHICMCKWGASIRCFPQSRSTLFYFTFRIGLWLTHSARLVDQQAPGISCHCFLSTGIVSCSAWLFNMNSGTSTKVLLLSWQVWSRLSHLPRPLCALPWNFSCTDGWEHLLTDVQFFFIFF